MSESVNKIDKYYFLDQQVVLNSQKLIILSNLYQ